MRWKDYEAAALNARSRGQYMPSLTNCVLCVFEAKPIVSRTEIVHRVSIYTGIEQQEVAANINNLLTSMEKANLIRHSGHNEWRIV